MKNQYTSFQDKTRDFRRFLFSIAAFFAFFLFSLAAKAQFQVQIGIKNHASLDNTVSVFLKMTETATYQLDSVHFTLRWPQTAGDLTVVNSGFAVQKEGTVFTESGYKYQRFIGRYENTFSWTAQTEYLALSASYDLGLACSGEVEIVEQSNDRDFYVMMFGVDNAHPTQPIYSQTAGDFNPLKETAITDSTNINCYGGDDGTATVTIAGGTPPFSILWGGGTNPTDQTVTGLSANVSYQVTVTDANNCTVKDYVTLSQPPELTASITDTQDPLCYNDANGSATVAASGGVEPYSYLWNDPAATTEPTVNGIDAKQYYRVTITDHNACTTKDSVLLSEPDQLNSTISETQNISCNGANDGSATVTPTGGTRPYSYFWDGGVIPNNDSIVSGLSPDIYYRVTITDANSCTTKDSAMVSEPDVLTSSIVETNDVSCFGLTDGSATVAASGGTPPYSYAWNDAAGTTDSTIQSLVPDQLYQVTIRDANDCVTSNSVTVSQPPKLEIDTIITTPVSYCSALDGSINITAHGGTGTLSYSLNGGEAQSSNNFVGLGQANYTVRVIDQNECTAVQNAEILEQNPVVIDSLETTNIECHGENTGQIIVHASGGTAPLTYSKDNVNYFLDNEFSELVAANYALFVKDANNCQVSQMVTLTQSDEIVITVLHKTDISECHGDTTGSLVLGASGGTGALQFSLDGENFQDENEFDGLAGGLYQTAVQDALGCINTLDVTILQPAMLTLDFDITDISCNGNADGAVNMTINGGTEPYDILWSNSLQSEDLNNLLAGVYTVTVSDQNDCVVTDTAEITEPTEITLNLAPTNVTCNGQRNGQIDLTVTGGTPTYRYHWSNGGRTEDIDNLRPGTYIVQVIDARNCTKNGTAEISEPPPLQANLTGENVSYYGESDGAIQLSVSGGTPPYEYAWSNGATTQHLDSIGEGDYYVTVTDSNLCEVEGYIKLITEISDIVVPNTFSPNADGINDTWKVRSIKKYEDALLQIFDKRGRLIYEDQGEIQPWDGNDTSGTPVPSREVYYYVIVLNDQTAPLTGTIFIVR